MNRRGFLGRLIAAVVAVKVAPQVATPPPRKKRIIRRGRNTSVYFSGDGVPLGLPRAGTSVYEEVDE